MTEFIMDQSIYFLSILSGQWMALASESWQKRHFTQESSGPWITNKAGNWSRVSAWVSCGVSTVTVTSPKVSSRTSTGRKLRGQRTSWPSSPENGPKWPVIWRWHVLHSLGLVLRQPTKNEVRWLLADNFYSWPGKHCLIITGICCIQCNVILIKSSEMCL